MRVAIIGAGVAGLASARRCLENDFEPIVYERSKGVGGTWVYEERTGLDEFGLPIHTSMYKNLMTNLPKELMDFPNFPYTGLDNVSFLKSWQVQEYIEQFTEHFGLNKYIRFCNLVTSVEKLTHSWQVTAEDLKTKTSKTEYYDAVMVCNGHNAMPFTPDIPGNNGFDGIQIHSHDYRIPEHFINLNVLIIGSGPSGIDICSDVSKVASQVYFSHHKPELIEKDFPKNVIHKPDVEHFSKKSVSFKDKTKQTLDAIIYCTGYKITLPFLKPSCGINVVNDKLITPLHKNIINMCNPTMGFIGYLNLTFVFRIFDLQKKKTHKFAIMNFEFLMMNKTSIVIISGAISNSLDRCRIRKLEGKPLLAPLHEETRQMRTLELLLTKKEIKRIFKCNVILREACLKQMSKSIESKLNNLNPTFIENYILKGNYTNVVVLWNGHSDSNILKRLKIDKFPILNITCYDKHFNQNFTIQLEKIETKEIIYEVDIGSFNKSGRLLHLEETHNIICSKKHRLTYAHDPKTDVRLTKCIFDFILRKQGYENLTKHF